MQKHLLRAVDLLRSGELGLAENALLKILRRWPGQGDALHFLGVLRHRCGDSDTAVELIRQAIVALPNEPGPWNNLGNILVEDQHFEEAQKAYHKCLEIDPNFLLSLSNLATIYNKRNQHVEAEALCRRAIQAQPDFGQAWYNLSVSLLAQERIEEGLVANSQAVLLWPKHLQARESVIRALVHLDRLEEAARLYREWLDVEPDNPVIQHLLAACTGQAPPERASDGYVECAFDAYAATFDASLTALNYRAPQLVADLLAHTVGTAEGQFSVADLGCGTGLCGPLVRAWARSLVGCDLSSGMLEKAAKRQVYDALVHQELVQFLQGHNDAFDILLCADTFCYFGSLDNAFQAAAQALKIGGWLIFTVEALPDDGSVGHHLQPHGRYAHQHAYLEASLTQHGFSVDATRQETLRTEGGRPVHGWLVAARIDRR